MHASCRTIDIWHKRQGGEALRRKVQRDVECPTAYPVYRVPSPPGSSSFPPAFYRLCAALCGVGEAASKAIRVEQSELEVEQDKLTLATLPELTVMMWRDSTVWELSHAALKVVRVKADEEYYLTRPFSRPPPPAADVNEEGVEVTSPAHEENNLAVTDGSTAEEEATTDSHPDSTQGKQRRHHSSTGALPARYRLGWWAGVLSFQSSKADFLHLMDVDCEQVMVEHPLLLPVLPTVASPDPRLVVLAEMSGFPGPGSVLFFHCQRIQ